MRVYLINLDRRPDRLGEMRAAAEAGGFAFERIAAVDGHTADWLRDGVVGRYSGQPLSRSEHACLESHRSFWRQLVESGDAHALVLEDDVLLAPGFADILSGDWVPADADIVKVETFEWPLELEPALRPPGLKPKAGPGREVARLRSLSFGTAGYIVSRATAERLLRETADFPDAVDRFLFDPASPFFRDARVYQLCPAPVIQADSYGDGEVPGWAKSDIKAARIAIGAPVGLRRVERLPARIGEAVRRRTRLVRWKLRAAAHGRRVRRIMFR